MWILATILGIVSSQTPLPPMWPDVFWQNFSEVTYYNGIGTHTNTGSYYYNWTMKAYRIDRSDGRYDRYCGLSGPHVDQDTPCTHIVVNGNRYLYFPELNECCYCCNSTMGCGVLFPGWMQDSTYIDTEIHNGVQTYKWSREGLQENYIWETPGPIPANRVTVGIYQVDDDDMNFDQRSNTYPPGSLDLPSICSLSNTCNWGFCQKFRSGQGSFDEYFYI